MMKWVAIFFLLANVGYFGLQMNQRLDQVVPATAINEEIVSTPGKPLVLLSELEELPPLRDETGSSEQETDQLEPDPLDEILPFDPQGNCVSIGPYESEEEILALKNWFSVRDMSARKRVEEKRSRERYWVYLEPQDEAEAKAQLEELKNKGLSDYYMISKGDMKNAISLGLFSSQEAVNQRLVELEREGYNPVVVPQHKISRLLWLDAQTRNDLALPVLPEGINITNIDCLEIALLGTDQ